jgi:hypothetical protein
MPSLGRESSSEAISLFLFSTIFLTEINKKVYNIYSGLPPDEEKEMHKLREELKEHINGPTPARGN